MSRQALSVSRGAEGRAVVDILSQQSQSSRSLFQIPHFCSKCDLYRPFCSGCHRPVESTISYENQGVPPACDATDRLRSDLGQQSEASSADQKCVACEFSRLGPLGSASGPERPSSQHQSGEEHHPPFEDECSFLCQRCNSFCGVGGPLQSLVYGSKDTEWYGFPVEDVSAMFHGKCLFCRLMSSAVEDTSSSQGGFLKVNGNGEVGVCLSREGKCIKVSTLRAGRDHHSHEHPNLVSCIPPNHKLRDVMHLAICADQGIASSIGASSKINLNIASDETFEHARSWILHCAQEHEKCQIGDNATMPTRLINVRSVPPRLVTSNGQNIRYAALSYCWGGKQDLELRKVRVTEYTQALPGSLPLSLRDAITTTRHLDLDHLWIDSLCIVQDDPDDREEELSRMGSIYENAFVTIVAASAWGVSQGFLESRIGPAGSVTIPLWAMDGSHGHGTIEIVPQPPNPDIVYVKRNPIERRAWTFQEKLLSPRKLVFSKSNLRWSCKTYDIFHGGSRDLLGSHSKSPFPQPMHETGLTNPWIAIVSEFSRRLLSVESDKMPANAAMAERHADKTTDTYLAGLWQSQLWMELMWIIQSDNLKAVRPAHYRGPTWSWAAVEEPVGWVPTTIFDSARTVIDEDFKVVSWTPVLKSSKLPYGSLLPGSVLTVQGRVVELGAREEVIEFVSKPAYVQDILAKAEIRGEARYMAAFFHDGVNFHNNIRFDDDDKSLRHQKVYALLTGHIISPGHPYFPDIPFGLFLSCDVADGNFKRIGVFWEQGIPSLPIETFLTVEPRVISLI